MDRRSFVFGGALATACALARPVVAAPEVKPEATDRANLEIQLNRPVHKVYSERDPNTYYLIDGKPTAQIRVSKDDLWEPISIDVAEQIIKLIRGVPKAQVAQRFLVNKCVLSYYAV